MVVEQLHIPQQEPIILTLDLDDTIFNASYELRRILKEQYHFTPPGYEVYLTDENTDGLISVICEDNGHLRTIQLFDELHNLAELLREFKARGQRVDVTTHRKGDENTVKLTFDSLRKYGLEVHKVHFINRERCPDKLAYLSKSYGHDNYVIFDDNPDHSCVDLTHHGDRIVLMDTGHNQHLKVNRRIDVSQLVATMKELSHVRVNLSTL